MNLIIFILTLAVSFVAVRIGAIAFHLTGLPWALAQFQALSCFSGTGFTTRESELITGDAQRRKIATFLIILGNAGLVTLIATFANSIQPRSIDAASDFSSLLRLRPMLNFGVILLTVYIAIRLFTHTHSAKKLTDYLSHKIRRSDFMEPTTFEELTVSTGGYGVVSVEIEADSPMVDKTLTNSSLRKDDISVLVIHRGRQTIANPKADTKLLAKDKVLCFGKLGHMKKRFKPIKKEGKDV